MLTRGSFLSSPVAGAVTTRCCPNGSIFVLPVALPSTCIIRMDHIKNGESVNELLNFLRRDMSQEVSVSFVRCSIPLIQNRASLISKKAFSSTGERKTSSSARLSSTVFQGMCWTPKVLRVVMQNHSPSTMVLHLPQDSRTTVT